MSEEHRHCNEDSGVIHPDGTITLTGVKGTFTLMGIYPGNGFIAIKHSGGSYWSGWQGNSYCPPSVEICKMERLSSIPDKPGHYSFRSQKLFSFHPTAKRASQEAMELVNRMMQP